MGWVWNLKKASGLVPCRNVTASSRKSGRTVLISLAICVFHLTSYNSLSEMVVTVHSFSRRSFRSVILGKEAAGITLRWSGGNVGFQPPRLVDAPDYPYLNYFIIEHHFKIRSSSHPEGALCTIEFGE